MILSLALTVAAIGWAQEPSADPWTELHHEMLRAHYTQVECELLAADVSGFDADQLAARKRAIEALAAYRERSDFGAAPTDLRIPRFVDRGGRRCAVAELIHVFGEDDLLERLARDHNESYLAELSDDPELRATLGVMGLTFSEASRIHAPVPGPTPDPTNPTTLQTDSNNIRGLPGSSERAAGPAPSRGASAAATGSRGGFSGGPRTGGSLPVPAPRSFTMTTFPFPRDLQSHWWTWWEFNKSRWLVSDELPAWKNEGFGEETRAETRFERLRRELTPLVLEHLSHPDGQVRAAAAVALPRLAGRAAIEPLLQALGDPQRLVRDNAILALGATGASDVVHPLLQLAYRGTLEGRKSVSPWARPLAITALATARERGTARGVERMLPTQGANRGNRDERLADAIFLHPFLTPSGELAGLAREASGLFDDHSEEEPSTRAIEALRFGSDDEVFKRVLRAIGHRDLQVRRSAVLTLGELGDARAVEPMMTAFELEHEHLTRGFLLLAIGRLGGESARDFLVHVLEEGSSTVRPWGALALGMLAESENDDVARDELRAAYLEERNRDARGAYVLAMGIAQDPAAVPILSFEMLESGNALDRSLCALALAISAPERAAEELREALAAERSPLTRAAMAQSLASLQEPEDAQRLVELLRGASDPTMQVQLAAAVGIHGTYETVLGVAELLREKKLGNHGRAAALQSLGILLDRRPPFRLAAFARGTNFTVLPSWIDVPLQSTL